MLPSLLLALGRPLLRLRYRIRSAGLEEVPVGGAPGILFLANHPTLVDPFLLAAELAPRFAPQLVAGRDHAASAPLRWLAGLLGGRALPDPATLGDRCREALDAELVALAGELRSGRNLLLFPGGRLARQKTDDCSDNSIIAALLRQAPGTRVVVVRLRGLWGSRFSAASGQRPRLGTELLRSLGLLWANALFFMPRRIVDLTFEAATNLPLEQGRAALNEAIQGLLTIFVTAAREADSLRGVHMRQLYPRLFQADAPAYERLLRLTDHVSGMTDHYAVRLYRELRGMRYPGGRD